MSKQYQVFNPSKFEIEEVKYNGPYRTSNGMIKSHIKYQNKPILIRTPKMSLGADVAKSGNDYYVDLIFNNTVSNKKFSRFITEIDHLNISEIYCNKELWYPDVKSAPLPMIENEYIPTIKLSTLYGDCKSLKFKAPIKNLSFFDQENVQAPYQLLKAGYQVVALLQLNHLYRDNNSVWADWNILQLKVTIPENIFDKCQLADINDNDDLDVIEEEVDNLDENFY